MVILLHVTTIYTKTTSDNSINQPSFGVKLGASFNRTNETLTNVKNIHSWQRPSYSLGNILWVMGGLTGEYPLSDQVAATAEILYERKGAYIPEDKKLQQESIVLPISIKYYRSSLSERISLQVGIQPSFAFSTKKYELTGGQDTEVLEKEIKEEGLSEEQRKKKKSKHLIWLLSVE